MDEKVKTATFSMQIQASDPQEFENMRTFVYTHMKSPQELNAVDVKWTVEVAFKVEDDGKFTDFNILQGLTPEIDAEVIRILKLYPEKPIIKDAQGNHQRIRNTINIEHPRAINKIT